MKDDKALRRNILEHWKSKLDDADGLRLPSGFLFERDGKQLTMTFLSEAGLGLGEKPMNMQENGAAFESWAVALYAHYLLKDGNILLSEGSCKLPKEFFGSKHYCRFLFRALWFSQQYSWFGLSPALQAEVERFSEFMQKNTFVNNTPTGDAHDKVRDRSGQGLMTESEVEGWFAGKGSSRLWTLLEGVGVSQDKFPVFRQLPVGFFKAEKSKDTSLFTGGASAIDLWTISGDRMVPIELKTRNVMAGAVTELLFYSAYCHQVFNGEAPSEGKDFRGYGTLCAAAPELTGVTGVLLLDRPHPLITDSVIRVLNEGTEENISYAKVIYGQKDVKGRLE